VSIDRALFLYLWVAPHVLQVALAMMLVRRKLVKEFPAFFSYTLGEVLQFVVLYTMSAIPSITNAQYWTAWVLGGILSVVLRFAVVQEIFRHVFRSYPALQQLEGFLFRWATLVLMILAVTLVGYTSGSGTDRLGLAVTVVDRAVSIIQCGLLVFLLLLARFLRFSWRSYVFGIALGLGLFASVQLAVTAMRAHLGIAAATEFFDLLSMATYHCCVLFWIVALYLPQEKATRVSSVPVDGLAQWNEALQQLLHQ
jgi:hypothetical protein